MSESTRRNEEARGDRCGNLSPYELGDRRVCEDCCAISGSCCLEFGADDLWADDRKSSPGTCRRA